MREKIEYRYKKFGYEFEEVDTWVAGIMLNGWEVTALKDHNGDIGASYCKFVGSELYLIGSKITPIDIHAEFLPGETRDRKLLLNKIELRKIRAQLQEKGLTCVPKVLWRNDRHLFKVEIAVVRPKKLHDKRETIKQRDLERSDRRGE